MFFSVYNMSVCTCMRAVLVTLKLVCALVFAASNLWCFKSHFCNADIQLIVHCATSEGSSGHMASPLLLVCMLSGSQLKLCSSQ